MTALSSKLFFAAGAAISLCAPIVSLPAVGSEPPDDYVYSAKPSPTAKKYFSQNPDLRYGVELKRGMEDFETGVCYMKNGDIAIPAGRSVTFSGSGCCMDPTLPAPGMGLGGSPAQFVQSSKLVHQRLRKAYARLLDMNEKGHRGVDQLGLQHLIWAIRTVGQENSYADSLSENQYKILDECMGAKGAFKRLHKQLIEKSRRNNATDNAARSATDGMPSGANGQIEVGGLSYNMDDLRDETKGRELIGCHIEELVQAGGKSNGMCPEDFRYGRLDKGFYSDVMVNFFSYNARILNVSNDVKVFRFSDYAIQVGNGTDCSKCQRIAVLPPVIIVILGNPPEEPENGPESDDKHGRPPRGKTGEDGTDPTNSIPEVVSITNVVNITVTNVVDQIETNLVEQIDTNIVQVVVTNIVEHIETNKVTAVEGSKPVFRIVELTYDVASGRGMATVKIQACTAKKAKTILLGDFSRYLFNANIYDDSKFDVLWPVAESIPRDEELRVENIYNRGNTIYVEFTVL